jgi:hypothetical protein
MQSGRLPSEKETQRYKNTARSDEPEKLFFISIEVCKTAANHPASTTLRHLTRTHTKRLNPRTANTDTNTEAYK